MPLHEENDCALFYGMQQSLLEHENHTKTIQKGLFSTKRAECQYKEKYSILKKEQMYFFPLF